MQVQYSGYVTLNSLPPLGQVQPKFIINGNPSYEPRTCCVCAESHPHWKPNTFKKFKATEEEMVAWVKESPLNKHLKEIAVRQPDQPPLPLDKGTWGSCWPAASSMVWSGPHGVHIVRGSSHRWSTTTTEASDSEVNPDSRGRNRPRTRSVRSPAHGDPLCGTSRASLDPLRDPNRAKTSLTRTPRNSRWSCNRDSNQQGDSKGSGTPDLTSQGNTMEKCLDCGDEFNGNEEDGYALCPACFKEAFGSDDEPTEPDEGDHGNTCLIDMFEALHAEDES